MKKLLFSFIALTCMFLSAKAVPSGEYTDSSGNRFYVTDSQNLYKLDSNGYIKMRYKIVNESSDGTFMLLLLDENDNEIPGTIPVKGNAWWNENGKTYLNVQAHYRTLVRN